MAGTNPNKLLVEGDEEKRTVPYLMDEYVVWGDRHDDWVVEISEFGGIESLLKPGVIEVELKTPGLNALGIIIDANDEFESRWSKIKRALFEDRSRLPGGTTDRRSHPRKSARTADRGLDHARQSGSRDARDIPELSRHSGAFDTLDLRTGSLCPITRPRRTLHRASSR